MRDASKNLTFVTEGTTYAYSNDVMHFQETMPTQYKVFVGNPHLQCIDVGLPVPFHDSVTTRLGLAKGYIFFNVIS